MKAGVHSLRGLRYADYLVAVVLLYEPCSFKSVRSEPIVCVEINLCIVPVPTHFL